MMDKQILAVMYQLEKRVTKRALKKILNVTLENFMFQLTSNEFATSISQNAISCNDSLSSQNVMLEYSSMVSQSVIPCNATLEKKL
jgi:hypothetical protein